MKLIPTAHPKRKIKVNKSNTKTNISTLSVSEQRLLKITLNIIIWEKNNYYVLMPVYIIITFLRYQITAAPKNCLASHLLHIALGWL